MNRNEQFKQFTKDCCDFGDKLRCKPSNLHTAYVAWAIKNKINPEDSSNFSPRFKLIGIRAEGSRRKTMKIGVDLKPEHQIKQDPSNEPKIPEPTISTKSSLKVLDDDFTNHLSTVKMFIDEIYESTTTTNELSSAVWREFMFWCNQKEVKIVNFMVFWDYLRKLGFNTVCIDRGKEVCGLRKKTISPITAESPKESGLSGLLRELVLEIRRIGDILEKREKEESEVVYVRKRS